jgi:hypothetical protein
LAGDGFFEWVEWGRLFQMGWMGTAFSTGLNGDGFSYELNGDGFFKWVEWGRFFEWVEWKRLLRMKRLVLVSEHSASYTRYQYVESVGHVTHTNPIRSGYHQSTRLVKPFDQTIWIKTSLSRILHFMRHQFYSRKNQMMNFVFVWTIEN